MKHPWHSPKFNRVRTRGKTLWFTLQPATLGWGIGGQLLQCFFYQYMPPTTLISFTNHILPSSPHLVQKEIHCSSTFFALPPLFSLLIVLELGAMFVQDTHAALFSASISGHSWGVGWHAGLSGLSQWLVATLTHIHKCISKSLMYALDCCYQQMLHWPLVMAI